MKTFIFLSLFFLIDKNNCLVPTLFNNATIPTYTNISKETNGTLENLLNNLFKNYDKRVRPFANNKIPLIINATLQNGYLIALETNSQEFNVVVYHDQRWVDPRLIWNPADYDNITNITVTAKNLWIFIPSIYNSMEIKEIIDSDYIDARVQYNGQIRVVHPQYVSCTCKISIAEFPFDTQFCPVSLEVPLLTINELDINILQPDNSTYFDGNMEYDVSNIALYYDRSYMVEAADMRAYYYYVFQIKRRPTYYIGVIVVPTFLTMALSILGIFAPGTSAEEDVNKGLATFFALTVLLSIVADEMPKSNVLPLLGIFILVNILICILTVLIAILLGWIKEKLVKSGRNPPYFLLRLFFVPYERFTEKTHDKMTENGYNDKKDENHNINIANGNVSHSTKKADELQIFKLSLKSLIDVHKENLEKLRTNDDQEHSIWSVFFDRIDLISLVAFELLIIANLIYFISFSWKKPPDMLSTFVQIYYSSYVCSFGDMKLASQYGINCKQT